MNEVENPDVVMGMEYAGSVGTMAIDELAEVNSCVSSAVDELKVKSKELERDGEDLDSCLEAEKERVWELVLNGGLVTRYSVANWSSR